jgi:hypothetical protein
MNRSPAIRASAAAVLMAWGIAMAQAVPASPPGVWRCGPEGRSYSSQPCAEGRQLALADARPPADVADARDRVRREQQQAERMEKQRLLREAEQRRLNASAAGISSTRPDLRSQARPAPPRKRKGAKSLSPAEDGDSVRAIVPGSRRKKG